jgi:hypothetical protein
MKQGFKNSSIPRQSFASGGIASFYGRMVNLSKTSADSPLRNRTVFPRWIFRPIKQDPLVAKRAEWSHRVKAGWNIYGDSPINGDL